MNTNRWYSRVFQSGSGLIRSLLPGAEVSTSPLGLDPAEPGDRHYRFEALEQKEVSHRHDGLLWSQESTGYSSTGSAEFHGRVAAQSLRFVQRHPRVEHLRLVVITLVHRWRCRS